MVGMWRLVQVAIRKRVPLCSEAPRVTTQSSILGGTPSHDPKWAAPKPAWSMPSCRGVGGE